MALEGELSGTQGVTCSCGEKLPFKVCQSAAGYYLGYFCNKCGPWSRESEYFATFVDAETFLKSLQDEGDDSKLRNIDFNKGDFQISTFEAIAEKQTLIEWLSAYLDEEK